MKIPFSKPGSSAGNKTGSWRSECPLILENCNGCGICVRFCPERCMRLITKEDRKTVEIDFDYCKGCGICANECPVKAVLMKKEGEK